VRLGTSGVGDCINLGGAVIGVADKAIFGAAPGVSGSLWLSSTGRPVTGVLAGIGDDGGGEREERASCSMAAARWDEVNWGSGVGGGALGVDFVD
jgi:hypothetical protein